MAARMPDDYDHHPAARRHLVKVVDFGSAIFKHPGPEKEWQDIQWIGKHLDAMLKRLRPKGGEIVLVIADPNIRKIFEITLLDRVFPIVDTLPEALERVTGAPAEH